MPIYAYRCESCGFEQDMLQKMSDAPLTVCPSCAAPTFRKQLTAAGFQLKGSGWYVTDFRDKGNGKAAAKKPDDAAAGAAKTDAGDAAVKSGGGDAAAAGGAAAAAAAPAPAAGAPPPGGSGPKAA